MSLLLHKKSTINDNIKENKPCSFLDSNIDLEKENRLSKVLSLYVRGLNQEEIAKEIGVDQSTICRDLQQIKKESRKKIEQYVNEYSLFEYQRCITTFDQITRKLWEFIEDDKIMIKDKLNALSLLKEMQCTRIVMLIGGPESKNNAMNQISCLNESNI